MFELFTLLIFVWLLIHAIRLALTLTWGIAKLCAGILMVLALPVFILCLIFAGGIVLIFPIVMVCIAAGILRHCLNS